VALLVGDVAGHGRTAVGRMRQLRDAGPVCALQRRGPASVLAQLDRFMGRSGHKEFATLWCCQYVPGSGELT
jgi:hypothetical protein